MHWDPENEQASRFMQQAGEALNADIIYVSSTHSHWKAARYLCGLILSQPTFSRLVSKGVKCMLERKLWLMLHLQIKELEMVSHWE